MDGEDVGADLTIDFEDAGVGAGIVIIIGLQNDTGGVDGPRVAEVGALVGLLRDEITPKG